MNRTARIAAAFAAFAAVLAPSVASADTNLMRLGWRNGDIGTKEAADEFAQDGFSDVWTYDAGTLPVVDRTPDLPRLLTIDEDACNDRGCARVMNVRFTVPAEYDGFPMTLGYSRFGSELNTIRIDGHKVGNLAGAEGKVVHGRVDLGDLEAGEHILQIQYTDYRRSNRHYIDYLSLIALD